MDLQAPIRPDDAVVFDLDGTLIDSAPDIHAAINHVLGEDGLDPLPLPLVTAFIGHGVAKLVERAYRYHGAAFGGDTVARFTDRYAENSAVLTRPFPGVVEGLQRLTGMGARLAVCTNKPRALSEVILAELDLASFFAAVVGGDSCRARKPDAEPLLACLETLGADPSRALYIGDSETDVQTARAAGIPVIAVTYGYAKAAEDLGADGLIDRIDRWVGSGSN